MTLFVHADRLTVDQCQLVLFSLFSIYMLVAFTLLRWVITSFFSCGSALVVELLYVLLLLLFICCPFGGIDAREASEPGRVVTHAHLLFYFARLYFTDK